LFIIFYQSRSLFLYRKTRISHGTVIDEGLALEFIMHLMRPLIYGICVAYPARLDNPRVPYITNSSWIPSWV